MTSTIPLRFPVRTIVPVVKPAAAAASDALDGATSAPPAAADAASEPVRYRQPTSRITRLVALGWTSARIGRHLQISERTVRKHLKNINDKLGTANRTAAVSRWRGLDPAVGSSHPIA